MPTLNPPERNRSMTTTNDILRRAYVSGHNPQAFAVHDELHPHEPELAGQVAGIITNILADPRQSENETIEGLDRVRALLLARGLDKAADLVPGHVDHVAWAMWEYRELATGGVAR